MKKICVVITARTSYTKIKPILHAIQAHPQLELQIICAGAALLSRYGEIDTMIEKDGFEVHERIFMVVEGENLVTSAKTTGLGLMEFAAAYERLKPDAVLVMADRYEQMAAAIPAAYMNIPLAHVQGGEVSGNIDEKVRHAITKLADLHFPSTQRAHDWILRMGENKESVFLSGCPSTDLCQSVIESPDLDFKVFEKYGGVGPNPNLDEGYIIVMQHPVTTEFGNAKDQALITLEAVHEMGIPTLWFWPNIDAGSDETSKAIRTYREKKNPQNIHFFRNMEPEDFLRVLYHAKAIIGNSSTGIRESSYLGTPSVNIGSRQMNRERAPNVIDVDYDKKSLLAAIKKQIEHGRYPSSNLYGSGNAGAQIAEKLAGAPLKFSKEISYLKEEAPMAAKMKAV